MSLLFILNKSKLPVHVRVMYGKLDSIFFVVCTCTAMYRPCQDKDLKRLFKWLCCNKISLNIYKTEVLLFQGPHKTTNHDIRLKLNGKLLSLSNSVKYLGVHLDKFLSWNKHLENLSSKLRKTNGLISKLRHSAPKSILLQFYYAFFESHMRYACQIWGQITTNCTRIFRLQKPCDY